MGTKSTGVADTFAGITDELIGALGEEITALKKGGGSQRYALHDGRQTGVTAGRFTYTFLLESELSVPSDSPAQLIVDDQSYDAIVSSLEGSEISLAVREDLGPHVPSALLSVAPYFLLELLQNRLREAQNGDIQVNTTMALKLFGRSPWNPVAVAQTPDPELTTELNTEQRAAILRSLGQEITFIWGPPGTGKTRTVGTLVRLLADRGERVLVTSHTNAAVDAALIPVVRHLAPRDVEDGAVVRIGTPQLQDPEVINNTLEAVVERKGAELRRRRQELERERSRLSAEEQRIQAALAAHEAVRRAAGRVQELEQELAQVQRDGFTVEKALADQRKNLAQLERQLAEAEGMSRLRQLFSGRNPQTIRRQMEARRLDIQQLTDGYENLQRRTAEVAQQVAGARSEGDKARQRLATLGDLPPERELQGALGRNRQAVEQVNKSLAQVDRELQELEGRVLTEARVIGATLFRLVLTEDLYSKPFDTVIVDEASMVPLTNLWFAAMLARRRVVITGDFRQLAPIATANDRQAYPKAAHWLRRDVFQEAGVVGDDGLVNLQDSRLAALSKQYRMHPSIGDLVNTLVYARDGHPLEHMAEETELQPIIEALPASGSPLVLCDTAQANPWCARDPNSFSRYNIYSAVTSVRLAAAALAQGVKRVGVVTPYRLQVQLIQALLQEYGLPRERVEVATVHRFQGGERDVIVLDLVDGPPHAIGMLMRGAFPREAARLLNVACSRARAKLIVVANVRYLEDKLDPTDSLAELLQYMGRNAQWFDATGVVRDHADPDMEKAIQTVRGPVDLGNSEGTTWFNEAGFYPAFRSDVQQSRKRITIFSPFIHANRLADVMTELRAAMDRGVKVTVVTRPAGKESNTAKLISEVKAAGAAVVERSQLHEKLAFIDERVAWFGSLNILSQRTSTEQMVRFENPEVVLKLMELSGTARLIREQNAQQQRKERLERLAKVLAERMKPPACPVCSGPTLLRSMKNGPVYACAGKVCRGYANIPRPVISAAVAELRLSCPRCGDGVVVAKYGKYGDFLSCSRYPNCKWSDSY